MKKADILYTSLTGFPNPDEGGGNRIVYELMKSVTRLEFRTGFFSYTAELPFSDREKNSGPKTGLSLRRRLGRRLMSSLPLYRSVVTSPMYYRQYLKRIDRAFSRFSRNVTCDIVHAHHPLALPYFSSRESGRILTIHSKGGFAYESERKGFFERYGAEFAVWVRRREQEALATADFVTFPSKAAKDLFFTVNRYDPTAGEVRVIYNGIDADAIAATAEDTAIFERYGIRGGADFYILNVAEHTVQKNIPTLLHAVKRIVRDHGRDVMMINVGKGSDTEQIESTVRGLDLTNHVMLLGSLPNTDVIRLMKKTGCFVLTSINVIFDLVVLEAMACGAALFVSDDGGNREIIRSGENGYLVPPTDDGLLARMLLEADRERVRRGAVRSIRNFSLSEMALSYEELYREILRKRIHQ